MTSPVGNTRFRAVTGAANDVRWDDQNGVVLVTHTAAATLSLPDDSESDWPLGSTLFVIQGGAGAVTVDAPGTATVTGTAATAAAGDTLIVTKTSANGFHSALAT